MTVKHRQPKRRKKIAVELQNVFVANNDQGKMD